MCIEYRIEWKVTIRGNVSYRLCYCHTKSELRELGSSITIYISYLKKEIFLQQVRDCDNRYLKGSDMLLRNAAGNNSTQISNNIGKKRWLLLLFGLETVRRYKIEARIFTKNKNKNLRQLMK